MVKILFAATEAVPFAKIGGLGDVIGALPAELNKLGLEVSVIMPKYQDIPMEYQQQMQTVATFVVPVGWRQQTCILKSLKQNDTTFYFLENDYYFERTGIYGFYDDAERFAFLCRGVLEAIPYLEHQPDIIHNHDWHTAMISVLLKAHYSWQPLYENIKTVLTIHNLQYLGLYSVDLIKDIYSLGEEYFSADRLETGGQASLLRGGLIFSDWLTTVSTTYAEEICSSDLGGGLLGLLRRRSAQLTGIINGIDPQMGSPANDPYLYQTFDARSLKKRLQNKLKLQEELGLPVSDEKLLIGMVARLVEQKGLDILEAVLEELFTLDVQLVVLGLGDPWYHQVLRNMAERFPDKLSIQLRFDDAAAHRIYGGSDIFLMPSKFEPCGISVINALRFGSIPIVHGTGGLKELVGNYDAQTGNGTGFMFGEYTPWSMLASVKEAVNLFADKNQWHKLVRNAMRTDGSWKKPAKAYRELYQSLINF